jgi:MarR family 2-MHQ and catechol resistance regulon transcriptional repressor
MLVTRANITGLIDKLESKGLVQRTEQHGDRRATIIELTRKGATVHESVSSKYRAFLRDALTALTEDEQRNLRDVLLKLQEGMTRAGG